MLIGGCCEEPIDFGKIVAVLFKVKEKALSHFWKTYCFPAGIIKDKETWHLVLFDTLSQDIAVEINMGQLQRVPARRLGK